MNQPSKQFKKLKKPGVAFSLGALTMNRFWVQPAIISLAILILFIFLTPDLLAQTPPPPNNGLAGGGTTVVGGGAPLADGLIMLISGGLFYGIVAYKEKIVEFLDKKK